MSDLRTTYMGIPLANPIIVGASGLTADMNTIREIAQAGAGALVTKSLFEEQIQLERFQFDEDREKYGYRNPEMITVGPALEFQGAQEHLMWVREAKLAVGIPVFASLNAVNSETWLADTGVDGLECNLFATPKAPRQSGAAIEDEQVALVAALKKKVALPIAVKLSPFYTNILEVVGRMDQAGADGFVLFNRLFEPDLDPAGETITAPFGFSRDTDSRLPLRYAALLEGTLRASLCCSTGIMDGEQVIKMILAGADAVQAVSALYGRGISQLRAMQEALGRWMDAKGYNTLADFRGKLSQRHAGHPGAYTRAQYARLLMNPDIIIKNAPVL